MARPPSSDRPILCAVLDGAALGHGPRAFAAALFAAGVDWIQLRDRTLDTARLLARIEGIPCGISSGAAVAAALELAARPGMDNKSIVVIVPSFAERYISSALFEGL